MRCTETQRRSHQEGGEGSAGDRAGGGKGQDPGRAGVCGGVSQRRSVTASCILSATAQIRPLCISATKDSFVVLTQPKVHNFYRNIWVSQVGKWLQTSERGEETISSSDRRKKEKKRHKLLKSSQQTLGSALEQEKHSPIIIGGKQKPIEKTAG